MYTLVLPNPGAPLSLARRLAPGDDRRPHPGAAGSAREVLARVGALAATSANLPGGPDPRTLDDVPGSCAPAAAALLDGGELPGTPSTVIDLTGPEPLVLREGAVPADEALRVVASVL